MKTWLLIPMLFLFLIGCEKDNIDEIPPGISILKPVENLVDSLLLVLPESRNFLLSSPELFSDTIQKNIVLIKESNVYVTFVNELTGNLNSLCWYAYNNTQPPTESVAITNRVLFPNISKKGEGGLLESGYTLQLGTEKFPAGTVIGFSLVVNGWKGGSIDFSGTIHYTNYNFNIGGQQQHVLFKNEYSHYIIIGYEDGTIANNPNCDKDFNDILFSVSDNLDGLEATSFDLSRIVVR